MTKTDVLLEATTAVAAERLPFKVRDLSLAEWGRKEIRLAEQEMPGLMAARREFGPQKPLAGLRVMGSLHMTVQTAVLIETLQELGADVRWASCNIFSTQDHAAAAVVVGRDGTPRAPARRRGLRLEGRDARRVLVVHGAGAPLARRVRPRPPRGRRWRCHTPHSQGCRVREGRRRSGLRRSERSRGMGRDSGPAEAHARRRPGPLAAHRLPHPGSLGGDHHGCAPSLRDGAGRHAPLPGDQRQRLGHEVEVRQPVRVPALRDRRPQPRHGRHDRGEAGRGVRVRRGGQGVRPGPSGARGARGRHRDRPHLRAAGGHGGIPGAPPRGRRGGGRHLHHGPRGNRDVITAEHMARMKDKAIVGNIGHFDNEIDMAGLKKVPGIRRVNIKPQYDEFVFPDGHSVLILAEGRLMNLGCATGHPSFVMSNSFTNQVIAQVELATNAAAYENRVYTLPKKLDEKVARLHLAQLGARLTELTDAQAAYIGVDKAGPYKPDHYRY